MQTSSTDTPDSLPRRLGLVTCIAIVVGVIIGSGIFQLPSSIAGQTGSAGGVAIVWVAGALVALCGALSVAELAAMFPRPGGPYVYLLEAFGKPLAFLFGWMFLLTDPISWAALALIFAQYLAFFVPLSAVEVHVVAALLIVVVAAANYRSVRLGAMIQNLSAGAKLLALLGLSAAIFYLAPDDISHHLLSGSADSLQWQGIGLGVLAVLWAYDGWQNFTEMAGEVRNPRRNIPLALACGVVIVALAYLLVNAAYLRALPFDALAGSSSVAADAAAAVFGRIGVSVVGALVMLSVFGSLNGSVMCDARVFFAMAEDRLFFQRVGRIHRRFRTPHVATVVISAIAVVYVLLLDFLQLAEAYVLGLWPFLALVVIGLFVLRVKRPDFPRSYRVPGYPVVPAFFVLAVALIVINSFWLQPGATSLSIGIPLSGIPVYFLWTWWQRRQEERRGAVAVDS